MSSATKLTNAYLLIDHANAKDPHQDIIHGTLIAKEIVYGLRMTTTLNAFEPKAPEALLIAARCQHICRWEIPREHYNMDRTGYLQWRTALKKFHADKASDILKLIGYDQETIDRVSFLLQKKQLKRDDDTQTLEDVICLVFLTYYFEAFMNKHPEQKIIAILQKTWGKMSKKGQEAALKIPYSETALDCIKKALNQ